MVRFSTKVSPDFKVNVNVTSLLNSHPFSSPELTLKLVGLLFTVTSLLAISCAPTFATIVNAAGAPSWLPLEVVTLQFFPFSSFFAPEALSLISQVLI